MSVYRPLTRLQLLRAAARPCVQPGASPPCIFRPISTEANSLRADKIRTSSIPSKYIWYLLSMGTGVGAGLTLSAFVNSRLHPPAPGSQEDGVALEALEDQMDELEIVKRMRAEGYQWHPATISKRPENEKGGWMELDIHDSTVEAATDGKKETTRTITQAMAGIQGLGIQKAFWNSETRELVAVVWIGPRLSGWPGLAHGGAIATIFQDVMSRMVAGPDASVDLIPTISSMSVTYARPTPSFNIYIMRTSFSSPDLPQDAPPSEPAPAKSWLPHWKDFTKKRTRTGLEAPIEISGTLESLDGEVKVRAKGTWPASAVTIRGITS